MKNIKWLSGVFIMLLGLSVFSACSEDEDTTKPNFPEKQPIDCGVGEEKTLTFNAEHSWTLASSKLWCKLKDGTDVVSSLSGGAGQHTITVTVTEDIWSFEDAIAELKLGMEGEIQVIAVVNRAAKLYHIEAYLQNGEEKIPYDETHPVGLLYSGGSIDVAIAANFGWKVKNCPEWMKVEEAKLMGEAGKVMEWALKFKSTNNFSKYDEQKVMLEFADKNGATRLTIPVEYAGMPEDEVDFIRPQNNYWNWVFSSDASQYWQASAGGVAGGEITKFDAPLNFTAMAKDELELVYLRMDEWGYTPVEVYYPGAIWFKATLLEDHKVELRVNPSDGKERKGCLMVVPAKVLAGLAGGIYDLAYEDGSNIKPEFERYIAFEFTQQSEEASDKGFDIQDDFGSLNSRVSSMQMSSDELITMFGTDNVFMLTLDRAKSYDTITITPKGYPNMMCQHELNGNTQEWGDISIEPNNRNGLYFSNISSGDKFDIYIHIKNGDETYAVLVINQYE